MQTRTGKPTGFARIQVVLDDPDTMTVFFEGSMKPLAFRRGQVPPRHWERLMQVVRAAEGQDRLTSRAEYAAAVAEYTTERAWRG